MVAPRGGARLLVCRLCAMLGAVSGDVYQHPNEDDLLWEIEAKHLEEAEFLFEVWESALRAPNYTLAEFAAGPEQRLLAHVDALIMGGPVVAERLLWPAIADPDECYELVAAASLAIGGARFDQWADRMLSLLADASEGDQRRGLMRALELLPDPALTQRLLRAIDRPHDSGTAAILEVLGQRRARVDDAHVANLLRSDNLQIARAAARLVRHCADPRALAGLAPLAQSADPTLRRAALETALCRQVGGAWESAIYWAFVPSDSPFRRDALTWVAILGDASAHRRLLALVDSPEHRADVLWALGFSGRVAAVDRCVALLDDQQVGALAAEVICAIAGLATEDDAFWAAPSVADEEAQTLPELHDDDLERDLVPDAEAALPLPEPAAIVRWWQAHRGSFDPAMRYLCGRPFTGEAVIEALARAPMRRRQVLALELEFRTGGALAIDTQALSQVQRGQLAGLVASELPNFQRGLPPGR